MKFLFTCGGTAGHINPAIGVAGKIKSLLPDSEILFVGAKGMMETELVPREGYPIETVTITNLSRSMSMSGLKHNIKTVKNVISSVGEAKRIIERFRPDVAIGTGGYVCYPVLKAAHSLGIPTLVHESNAVPGLTTKLLSGVVDCVMLGFKEAGANYRRGVNTIFTGTPVRSEFYTLDKAKARQALGIGDGPLVLSVWGSLGSAYMNRTITQLIEERGGKFGFALIHSAGKRYYAGMKAELDSKCPGFESRELDVREYIYDMPLVMAAADVILCRSGASTIAELTALGRPALFVPSPNVTGNHQEKNARLLEKCGGAKVLLEGEFTSESLYTAVMDLLENQQELDGMSAAMRASGNSDAADTIADIILGYLK